MDRKGEDIRYLISIDCLEKELDRLFEIKERIVKVIIEIERDIDDLKRDRMLNKRKG